MKCFVISPIGDEGTDVRAHADEVFNHVITPALAEYDIEPIRSDRMAEPGKISDQMYRAIFEFELCIAVLTYANPNVYYELAVAQSASRPVLILIASGWTLPFDIKDFRCLTYDLTISAYKQRTHINQLIKMLEELKQTGWRGDDVFRAYRGQTLVNSYADVQAYGIRITAPAAGDVNQRVDVQGEFQLIPPGRELRALRYYPRENGFIPQGAVAIDRAAKTWRVSGFDIGGQAGEERGIDIALAGPNARVLLDYWHEANAVHLEAQKQLLSATGNYSRWLPPIRLWPEDLVTCQRVLVRRQ